MPTLSLAMIVRDEEFNLSRCLKSVKGVFDQIIVVDTGSVDKTKDIAKSFNAEIHDFQWINDFSAARNFSFSKCTCDYIMWLDADDEILPNDKNKLLELKPRLDIADAFLMPYDYSQDESGKSICSLYRHRIVKGREHTPLWRWPIHECMMIPADWKQHSTDIVVTHRRSDDDYVRDIGRNITMLKKAVEENPTEPRLLFYYAKELFSENKTAECLPVFEKYYELGGGWHDDQVNGYYMMALAHLGLGKEDAAIDTCLKGIKLDPRWAEFYVTIGQIHYNHGRWGQAIPWFELADKLPVPETWGTVLQDNYTWVPSDRLCKCYSEVGKIREAYAANEKALTYRPNDNRLLFNREFLRDHLFPGRKAERPTRLSLGSGGKQTLSYRCTDLYPAPHVEEVFDQGNIPYPDGSIHSIYSEHALEHVGHTSAENSVREWARVLRHGGSLTLKVPDLDACCQAFVAQEDRTGNPNEPWSPKEWFKFCLYGIQDVTNDPNPDGQYHRTGFTQKNLQKLLENNGFEIQSNEKYDGWGTPSIKIQATQVKQPMKVVWLIPGVPDEDHGSLRIRRLNIHRWLLAQGVDSQIVDANKLNLMDELRLADVVILISFGPAEKILVEKLKRFGVKVVFDHNEDIDDLPYQSDVYQMCDVITCCSSLLASKSQSYGRTCYIPDAYESPS